MRSAYRRIRVLWVSLPKNRDFLLLLSGRVTSLLGDELNRIVVLWLVLQTTGSAVAMGTLMVVNQIVSFMGGLAGGVVADRVSRKGLMASIDLIRFVLFGFLAWRAWTGQLTFPEIVLVLATARLLEAFFDPALAATLPLLVERFQLAPAIGFSQALAQITEISGPIIGGLITKLFGYVAGIAANALSFLLSAISILLIRGPTETTSPGGG